MRTDRPVDGPEKLQPATSWTSTQCALPFFNVTGSFPRAYIGGKAPFELCRPPCPEFGLERDLSLDEVFWCINWAKDFSLRFENPSRPIAIARPRAVCTRQLSTYAAGHTHLYVAEEAVELGVNEGRHNLRFRISILEEWGRTLVGSVWTSGRIWIRSRSRSRIMAGWQGLNQARCHLLHVRSSLADCVHVLIVFWTRHKKLISPKFYGGGG